MHAFRLHNRWALGDTICLAALARDLQRAYPGKYEVYFSGHYDGVFWRDCPFAQAADKDTKAQLVDIAYLEGIRAAGRGVKKHFLSWFHHDFEQKTGVRVPVTEAKGWAPLPKDKSRPFPFRYWVVVAGGKLDMTAKVWYAHRWQEVIDALAQRGIRCVQAGARMVKHFQPTLKNVEQWVDKTRDEREFFRLIYHAEGVMCGITAAMHAAAVFDKPCVVVAGGREEPWWEAYTNWYFPDSFGPTCKPVKVEHKFLHTVGILDCGCGNLKKGCWKDRTVPIEKADTIHAKSRQQLCLKPVRDTVQAVPLCMDMIQADHVVEAVMGYYESGELPPIKQKTPQDLANHLANKLGIDPPVVMSPSNYPLLNEKGEQVGWSQDLHPEAKPPHPNLTWDEIKQRAQEIAGLPKEYVPPKPDLIDHSILDHPYLAGKVTVCILGFGDGLQLMQRCLGSILDHTPQDRLDIRAALNQPSKPLLDYVQGFDKSVVTKIYLDRGCRKKYPAMREMFWDHACPITTPYVVWFDDDSHVIDKKWLVELATTIVANHGHGSRLFGTRFTHDLIAYKRQGFNPEKWFKAADWWKNEWLFSNNGARLAPNGSQILFVTGGFWALALEAIRQGNIPDVRLNHNGGDITIGCQVTQAGFKVCDFSRGKKPVCWSDAKRRGYKEDFPWVKVV